MADELADRVQTLPPELFNIIVAEVLEHQPQSIPPTPYRRITREFKFPKQLHIDRTTREEFTAQVFDNSIRVFTEWTTFGDFISMLDERAMLFLCGIQIVRFGGWRSTDLDDFLQGRFLMGMQGSNRSKDENSGNNPRTISDLLQEGVLGLEFEGELVGCGLDSEETVDVWYYEWW